MDGFKRPSRRPDNRPVVVPPRQLPSVSPTTTPTTPPVVERQVAQPRPAPIDLTLPESGTELRPQRKYLTKRRLIIGGSILGLLILGLIGFSVWYFMQLKPVNPSDTHVQRVEIKQGTAFSYIAGRLHERGLIRSTVAFDMYARLSGKRSAVQAGTCSLTPAESAPEILDKLTSGCHDFRSVTFYPGATLTDAAYSKTISVRGALEKAGYEAADIDNALTKEYSTALFQGKPAGATLEGYVYGDTFYLDTSATASDAVQKALNEMWTKLQATDSLAQYSAQGLTLYQAITIASVVQSELGCWDKAGADLAQCQLDQKQIAQVFLKRYREGGSLGSDMTAYYGAHLAGQEPNVKFDSPYNTRLHAGLPPGPISAPGIDALVAVASPSKTSYNYFLAGDDGKMYYANTLAEHESNIKNHCQKQCSVK